MNDPAAVRELEELTLTTSPAVCQAFHDGWVLRASGTDTRRANSVTALAESRLPLADKIAYCEAWYARHGQPAIFRFTKTFMPAHLDALLEARGYTREVDTWVMTADLAEPATQRECPPSAGVRLVERSEDEGIADVHRLKHVTGDLHERDAARQALWRGPQAYRSLKTINGLASTGMARVEGSHLGIFSMRTAERARGKGYASTLLADLLTWGRAQGARRAFLQVEQANEAAIALYRGFGFVPTYNYWHRVQPSAAAAQRKTPGAPDARADC